MSNRPRIIDLSVPLQSGIASDPPMMLPEIDYLGHAETAPQVAGMFPGLRPEQLREARAGPSRTSASRRTTARISTRRGISIPPWTAAGGRSPSTRLPLDWCFRPGVKLDFRHLPDGHVVSAAEVEAELARVGHALRPFDIVLINTAAGAAYGQPDYLDRGCGMGREATLWLTERGVKVTGTDAWSWDAPSPHAPPRFAETGDASLIWEGHKAGAVARLLPHREARQPRPAAAQRLHGRLLPREDPQASAGWTRAVAILD